MKFLWTIIWSLLLGHMIYYVLGAMSGATYDFGSATIVGVVFAIFVTVLGSALSKSPEEA